MLIRLRVILVLLLLPAFSFAQSTQSEPITEEEIRQQIELELSAYDSMDTEAVASNGYGLDPGFGFRTQQERTSESELPHDALLAFISGFFDRFEYYNATIVEIYTRSFGDTGIGWGVHLEEFQMKGQPPESVRVRFSYTFRRDEAGKLVSVLGHRDAQIYDDSGVYIPESYQ